MRSAAERARGVAAFVVAWEAEDQIRFRFSDHPEEAWPDALWLAEALPRPTALTSEAKPLFLIVAEHIVRQDPRVSAALER